MKFYGITDSLTSNQMPSIIYRSPIYYENHLSFFFGGSDRSRVRTASDSLSQFIATAGYGTESYSAPDTNPFHPAHLPPRHFHQFIVTSFEVDPCHTERCGQRISSKKVSK